MPNNNNANQIETELIKITPEIAMTWMSARPDFQRRIDQNQVKKLVYAIRKNEWRINGGTIVFDAKGNLLDGQHRLEAIARANKSVEALVVRGIACGEDTFATIGDEKPRRIADFLHCKYASNVAGAMRFYWLTENNLWPVKGKTGLIIPFSDLLKITQPHVEYLSGLVPGLYEAGKITTQPSFCLFLMFWMTKVYQKHINKTAEFFGRAGDGTELTKTSPIYLLRKRFLDLMHTMRIPRYVAQGLILKALNLYIMDKEAEKLRFEPDREEFPPLPGYKK